MEKHHPGECEATEWGKRYYGGNLVPQSFDAPGHQWHLAKDKNWGPWSCCGGKVDSPDCQERSKGALALLTMNKMKTIKFLNQGNSEKVVADAGNWKMGVLPKRKTKDWLGYLSRMMKASSLKIKYYQ
jgi:hypothetical protein